MVIGHTELLVLLLTQELVAGVLHGQEDASNTSLPRRLDELNRRRRDRLQSRLDRDRILAQLGQQAVLERVFLNSWAAPAARIPVTIRRS